MLLIYRGQHFQVQPTQRHLTVTGTRQTRTFIYRGATYTCEVLVPTELRRPRAVNWRYDRPQQTTAVTELVPAL